MLRLQNGHAGFHSCRPKMMTFEIVPEVALRNESIEFILGMPLCQAIAAIQKLNRLIKNVELLYSQEDALSQDVHIKLTNDGISLIFDAKQQLLKVIEIYDLSLLSLRYCSTVFSTAEEPATIAKIEQSFGATHPGVYDSHQQVYTLSWRGLSFCFPMESSVHQSHYAHGLSSLQLPKNGSSPTVSKVSIYSGPNLAEQRIPPIPYSCFDRNCFTKLVETVTSPQTGLIETLQLMILAEDGTRVTTNRLPDGKLIELTSDISFGEATESVVTKLGGPSRVFYKSEDKMRIHRPPPSTADGTVATAATISDAAAAQRRNSTPPPTSADYFFNYFTLGMDILFDAETHCVKKFVLHTNFPGHFDFGIYNRCNFNMKFTSVGGSEFDDEGDNFDMNTLTKWEDVSDAVLRGGEDSYQQPVVLNRSSANGITNPFGSTFCYGYRNVILEVMENGQIVTVTIFDPEFID